MLQIIRNLLVYDQEKKQYSHLKMWSNVGYGVLCYAFVYQVLNTTVSTELYLVFGALILGNRTLSKYLHQKKEQTDVSSQHSEKD